MKFLILNGPNINLARWSEPGVPGEVDYTGLMDYVQAGCDQLGIETDICQSNHEGDLIDEIQSAPGRVDGIVTDVAKIIPAVAAFLLICSFSFAIFSFVFIILSVAVFITVLLNFRPFGLN